MLLYYAMSHEVHVITSKSGTCAPNNMILRFVLLRGIFREGLCVWIFSRPVAVLIMWGILIGKTVGLA